MHYFYHHKLLSIILTTSEQHSDSHELVIQYEFSQAAQEDGHSESHGDSNRGFAECLFGNLPRAEIAEVLKEHGISGIKKFIGYNIVSNPLNVLSQEAFMPLYKMKIAIQFKSATGPEYLVADQLVKSISWQDAKKAIFEGHAYHRNY